MSVAIGRLKAELEKWRQLVGGGVGGISGEDDPEKKVLEPEHDEFR